MTDLTDDYLDALQQALMSGEQADMDGCRVKVSRQACEEAAATITALRQREATAMAGVSWKPMVYVASKAKYGPEWVRKRDAGYPIVSSWIDQSGVGETSDWPALWCSCITEASQACALVLICRDGDTLKGAWAEAGAALAAGRLVFACGIEGYSIRHHKNVHLCATEDEAFIRAYAETFNQRSCDHHQDATRAALDRVRAEGMREAARRVAELEKANASLQYALAQHGIGSTGSIGLPE